MLGKKRNEIVLSRANLLVFQIVWRSIAYVWGTDKINLIHMTLSSVDEDSKFTIKQFTVDTAVEYRGSVTEVAMKVQLLRNQEGKWFISEEPELMFPSQKDLKGYRVRLSFYVALLSGKDLEHCGYDREGRSFSSGTVGDRLPWIRETLLKN